MLVPALGVFLDLPVIRIAGFDPQVSPTDSHTRAGYSITYSLAMSDLGFRTKEMISFPLVSHVAHIPVCISASHSLL